MPESVSPGWLLSQRCSALHGFPQLAFNGLHSWPSSASTYSGNITATANTGATSTAAVTLTVNPYATTTALASSLNPAQAKQNITYTATVSPATATGTVTFLENGVSMGTGTLVSGQATLTTFFAIAGTHNITASYSGSGSYGASTSTNLSQVVTQIPTTTTMSASPNPGTQNQNVTLTATVLPAAATGTVTFTEGATTQRVRNWAAKTSPVSTIEFQSAGNSTLCGSKTLLDMHMLGYSSTKFRSKKWLAKQRRQARQQLHERRFG